MDRVAESYRELHETILQHYDIFVTDEFYKLGFSEAMNMIYAARVREIDKMYAISMAAWRFEDVKSTKQVGSKKNKKTEPVYKTFTDFFDYQKRLDEARGIAEVEDKVVNAFKPSVVQALMRANSAKQTDT